jgi:hypothetical protein
MGRASGKRVLSLWRCGSLYTLVKIKNFATSKNKFGYVYVLTPTGMAEKADLTHRFLQRKMDEYKALKAEIDALWSEVEKFRDHGTQKS